MQIPGHGWREAHDRGLDGSRGRPILVGLPMRYLLTALGNAAATFLLLAAGCAWPPVSSSPPAPGPGEERAAAALRTIRVAEGLAPFQRFLGDWEGTDEGLRGNFEVARRLSWLVPDSFLLEQWRFLAAVDGREVARSANLYTFDPEVGLVRVQMLEEGGRSRSLWLRFTADGLSWTLHAAPGEPPLSRFRTARLGGDVWEGTLEMADPEAPGGWRVVERVSLRRR